MTDIALRNGKVRKKQRQPAYTINIAKWGRAACGEMGNAHGFLNMEIHIWGRNDMKNESNAEGAKKQEPLTPLQETRAETLLIHENQNDKDTTPVPNNRAHPPPTHPPQTLKITRLIQVLTTALKKQYAEGGSSKLGRRLYQRGDAI